ncbi:unnamed protein product [Somion occarium]|uniref:LYR motif-containing protein Cup1-like N-terminal domain-containing protein n=1 Tax=Somion occarium TaxID=3059160 RepID=A0ABP1CHD5_9APHY
MSIRNVPKVVIDNLQRSFERQINRLPTEYLRQFFRIKVGDDVQAIETAPTHRGLQNRKLKRAKQTLRMLENANNACPTSWNRMLDIAYGRKGKMKWELLDPLMVDPTAPLPERIIPAVEKSRPPSYTPELAALLTSSISRTAKALTPKSLQVPPSLPERADPNSEQAKLLGPFSKRREVNIHKRFFKEETAKILPPLQISALSDLTASGEESATTSHIRGTGLEATGLLEEVKAISGDPWKHPTPTLRGRQSASESPNTPSGELALPTHTTLPRRFLRRRFQQLLSRLPIVTHKPSMKTQSNAAEKKSGRFFVTRSAGALLSDRRNSVSHYPTASAADVAWYELAESEKKSPKGKKNTALQDIDKQKSEG